MENENNTSSKVHMGRNIARFRILKGYKQEKLAQMIGLPNQQTLSRLENKQTIEPELLRKIAPLLGVSVEVLQTFEEEPQNIVIENNTFEEGSANNLNGSNSISTFQEGSVSNVNSEGSDNTYNNIYHPIDQIVELFKEKERKEQERMEAMEKRMKELEEKLNQSK